MKEMWFFGVAAGILLVVLIGIVMRKAKRGCGEFDERQELLRSSAHKHAFFTVLILSALYAMFAGVSERGFMADGVACGIVALIGVGVFAVDCVLHDAFFTVKKRPGSYLLIAGLCVVCDGIGGIANLAHGECVQDGLLTMGCLPLVTAAVFLAVFLAIIYKVYLKKEAEDE